MFPQGEGLPLHRTRRDMPRAACPSPFTPISLVYPCICTHAVTLCGSQLPWLETCSLSYFVALRCGEVDHIRYQNPHTSIPLFQAHRIKAVLFQRSVY
jgi:hypothetical protein